MKKISEINEGLWNGIVDRGTTGAIKKEDAPEIEEQDPVHWWRYIELKNPKKYKKDEVASWKLTSMMVERVEKTMNIKKPQSIYVCFKNEVWDLTIERDQSYGGDRYIMRAHGSYNPWYHNYSKLTLNEMRSIRQRLETKTFYVYTYDRGGVYTEYYLKEQPQFKGEKGILLKTI